MNIIPAFNCLDEESLGQWILRAGEFLPSGEWIHVDISDGEFTYTKTWSDPARWQELAGKYGWNLEVHLMVLKPEEILQSWLEAGAKRAVVHVETITPDSLRSILGLAAQYKAEIMLSSNPETPFEQLRPYVHATRYFQVLGVNPGLSGQKLRPAALEKVKLLRAILPNARIEVDGGINPETAQMCKEAGAEFVAVTSYIFWGSDAKGAYSELQEVARM